jgi:hypothetical protein
MQAACWLRRELRQLSTRNEEAIHLPRRTDTVCPDPRCGGKQENRLVSGAIISFHDPAEFGCALDGRQGSQILLLTFLTERCPSRREHKPV